VIKFLANIANRADVEKLPEEIIAVHGCIDGIINNAGILQVASISLIS
jgi:NAD(P)-dependent dehydrogenase (short-subunit alcohol dehydrogenase family)